MRSVRRTGGYVQTVVTGEVPFRSSHINSRLLGLASLRSLQFIFLQETIDLNALAFCARTVPDRAYRSTTDANGAELWGFV